MRTRGQTQFDQPQLPGLGEGTAQTWQPAQHVVEGAARFSREHGRKPTDYSGLSTVQYPTQKAYAGHLEYKRNVPEPPSPRTTHSYESMRADIGAQYHHLTKPESEGGMGFTHEVTEHDPYPTAEAMAADVAQKRIKTFSTRTTGGHQFFSNEENDQFRAVHDVFGHAAVGRGFSRHGEEAAYRAHAQMFRPSSLPALGSELRHQTSHLIFTGDFPENKSVNLSDWAVSPKQGRIPRR
jgi:hypothetical protein